MKSYALSKAQELNVPSSLVDRFVGESDEDTDANLQSLKETFDKHIQKVSSLNLKASGRDVRDVQENNTTPPHVKSIEEMAQEVNIRK